jgi:hypothetical protein
MFPGTNLMPIHERKYVTKAKNTLYRKYGNNSAFAFLPKTVNIDVFTAKKNPDTKKNRGI